MVPGPDHGLFLDTPHVSTTQLLDKMLFRSRVDAVLHEITMGSIQWDVLAIQFDVVNTRSTAVPLPSPLATFMTTHLGGLTGDLTPTTTLINMTNPSLRKPIQSMTPEHWVGMSPWGGKSVRWVSQQCQPSVPIIEGRGGGGGEGYDYPLPSLRYP